MKYAKATRQARLTFSSGGEGDLCFNELLEAIIGKRTIESILGVSFRNDGRFIHNPQRPLEDLQFLRWKYKRKYSTFFKTTPVFKANFATINLLRVFLLRPYYRLKNFFTSLGKTERKIFERDMRKFVEMNNFFDNNFKTK